MHYDDARLDSEASPKRPSDRTLFRHLFFTPDVVWPLLRLLDAGVVAATGVASYLVRHEDVPEAIGLLLVVATTLVAAHTLGASKLYDQTRQPTGFLRRCRKALSAWLITIMVMLVVGWATKSTGLVSRLWIGTWMIGGGAGLIAVRVLEAWIIERANHLGLLRRRVGFIVPPTVEGLSAFKRLLSRVVDPHLEPCGIYLVDPDVAPQTADLDVPVRGSLDALETDIAEGFVQEVVIVSFSQGDVLDGRSINAIRRLPARCAVIIDANAPPGLPQTVIEVGGLPALQVASPPLSNSQLALKRSFDVVVSSLLVVLLAPLFLLIALAIWLESPGAIFFRQERQGFAGERFTLLKFRSMGQDRTDATGRQSTQRKDSRVTRVGRFMRRTSIDELPQLFNVLQGQMSLVGPRPHALGSEAEGELFWDVVDDYHARHRVKPGITGWAQVNGWRGATETQAQLQRRVQFDLWYADNWSLVLDVKVLAMTLFALSGDRAY